MAIITIKHVSKSYGSDLFKKKKLAVNDTSFDIHSNEIFGIIGANGAGKSTIIKMILGFIRPDIGEIRINDKTPFDSAARIKMGYLPENPYFYANLSALELLRFSSSASGLPKKESEHRIDMLLKKVDLYSYRKQRLKTFSKGMVQRAGICFAIVHDPEIVVLDEPMSGLDPLGRKMVVDLINDLKEQGKTILFCSHILNDVERICDRVAVMDKGGLKKIFHQPDFGQYSMEDMFLQVLESSDHVQ